MLNPETDEPIKEVNIVTTKDSVIVTKKLVNKGKTMISNIKFFFIDDVTVIEPKVLPDHLIPDEEVTIRMLIPSQQSYKFPFEVTFDFTEIEML